MSIESHPRSNDEYLDDEVVESSRDPMEDHPPYRVLTMKVIVPRKLKLHSTSDFKLMLASLRNAIAICSVYVSRLERELRILNSYSNERLMEG